MPRVNVQTKSTRGKPVSCGRCREVIKPGEKYRSWSFRYGGAHFRCMKSACAPRSSELTQSRMSEVYAITEQVEDAISLFRENKSYDDLKSSIENAISDADNLADEFQSSFDGMGDGLQQSDNGQAMEQRVSALQEYSQDLQSALDTADLTWEEASDEEADLDKKPSDEEKKTIDETVEEIAGEFDGVSCNAE